MKHSYQTLVQLLRLLHVKLCFSFDDATTNESIGFYSLAYGVDIFENQYDVTITIDELYISNKDKKYDWLDALCLHLASQIHCILYDIKNKLTPQHTFNIQAVIPNDKALEDLLSMVVESTCQELSISYS
jgi:hypothetical protein